MKFYDGMSRKDNIIESIKSYNNANEVKYLNNDTSVLYSESEYSKDNIKNDMLNQAIKRDKDLFLFYKNNFRKSAIVLGTGVIGSIVSLSKLAYLNKGTFQLLICLTIILILLLGYLTYYDIKKYFDLKKYHVFLSIRDELKKEENKNILDIIEFDKFFQVALDIDTLDKYSYNDLRILKKEINRRNNV